MQTRNLMVLVVVFILLLGMMRVTAQESFQESAFIPTDLYDSMEILSNSEFKEPIEFGVFGDCGEFSYTQDLEFGTVTLNWTHIPGNEIEYNLTDPYNATNTLEFILNI
ncbi:MAG: hypothetical protein ACXAEF_16570 [Candidatus Thorarchaeota archaeon]|jgi:hypothetical protein